MPGQQNKKGLGAGTQVNSTTNGGDYDTGHERKDNPPHSSKMEQLSKLIQDSVHFGQKKRHSKERRDLESRHVNAQAQDFGQASSGGHVASPDNYLSVLQAARRTLGVHDNNLGDVGAFTLRKGPLRVMNPDPSPEPSENGQDESPDGAGVKQNSWNKHIHQEEPRKKSGGSQASNWSDERRLIHRALESLIPPDQVIGHGPPPPYQPQSMGQGRPTPHDYETESRHYRQPQPHPFYPMQHRRHEAERQMPPFGQSYYPPPTGPPVLENRQRRHNSNIRSFSADQRLVRRVVDWMEHVQQPGGDDNERR